jgi:hypothetical protein
LKNILGYEPPGEGHPVERLDLVELFIAIGLVVPGVMVLILPAVGMCSVALAVCARSARQKDAEVVENLLRALPARPERLALGVVAGGSIAPIQHDPAAMASGARSIDPPAAGCCAACGALEGPARWVACSACDASHHLDCWAFAGGCSIYGCQQTPEAPRRPPSSPLAPPKKGPGDDLFDP